MTDGNYKQELSTYIKHNQTYMTLLTNCPFPQCKVHVIYKQCYLPMVGYPLPATIIPPAKLNKNQQAATTIFLTKMGSPKLSPCNHLCTQRLWRYWASPLWHRPRTSQSTTNDQTHQEHDKYRQGIQHCNSAALPVNVQIIVFDPPGHQTNPMEHSTVVWHPLTIPTFYHWPDYDTESLDPNMA